MYKKQPISLSQSKARWWASLGPCTLASTTCGLAVLFSPIGEIEKTGLQKQNYQLKSTESCLGLKGCFRVYMSEIQVLLPRESQGYSGRGAKPPSGKCWSELLLGITCRNASQFSRFKRLSQSSELLFSRDGLGKGVEWPSKEGISSPLQPLSSQGGPQMSRLFPAGAPVRRATKQGDGFMRLWFQCPPSSALGLVCSGDNY